MRYVVKVFDAKESNINRDYGNYTFSKDVQIFVNSVSGPVLYKNRCDEVVGKYIIHSVSDGTVFAEISGIDFPEKYEFSVGLRVIRYDNDDKEIKSVALMHVSQGD